MYVVNISRNNPQKGNSVQKNPTIISRNVKYTFQSLFAGTLISCMFSDLCLFLYTCNNTIYLSVLEVLFKKRLLSIRESETLIQVSLQCSHCHCTLMGAGPNLWKCGQPDILHIVVEYQLAISDMAHPLLHNNMEHDNSQAHLIYALCA